MCHRALVRWGLAASIILCVCQANPVDCGLLAAEPPAGLRLTAAPRVHPLSIGNEQGPLLQVTIQVDGPQGARATAFSFSLEGTDSLADVAALSLFRAGDNGEFSTTAPVGEAISPASKATFRFDEPLHAGANVFWLAARLQPAANLLHRVVAECQAVETTEGRVEADVSARPANSRIGVALHKANDEGVHTFRIPALASTPAGTLLCAYDMRRRAGRDLQEDIDVGLSRSTDGGQTWETTRVIMDMGEYGGFPQEQNGCSDPGMIVDRNTGEIFCFAVWLTGKPGKHQWTDDGSEPGFEIGKSAQFMMVRSKDDGRTWSEPENLTRRLKKPAWWLFAPAPQQGITLADGTLVMPTQGRDEQGVPFANIMYSRDHGDSWVVGEPAFSGGNECQAVQLGDGSIMLNMRNDHDRFRAVFVTDDLGQTWRPHATNRQTLIEPNCNGSLYRVDYRRGGQPKRVLLFANPHTQQGRTHQTIQVSFDDGATWPEAFHTLLDEGRGAGYPSLTRVDDEHVGLVYEGSQAHLVYEKFSLRELLKEGDPSDVGFSEHALGGKYSYAYGLAAADLDGDGDLDLTSSDIRGKAQSTLLWYENDGRGEFSRHAIHDGEPGWFERHAIGDITGDGRPDVAVVNNRDGQLVWFANGERPAAGPWQRRVISTQCPRAYDVTLADLDGDGDLDAATAGYASNTVAWFENPGAAGWDAEWAKRVIDDKMPESRTIRAGDFNRDGKIDLLAASVGVENVPLDVTDVRSHGSSVVWYENSGQPASGWTKHVIDEVSRAPIHGQPVDLDGDGDLDVAMAHGMRGPLAPVDRHQIAWYENAGAPGHGLTWRRHVVGAMPFAFEAHAADLDGDGDLDLAATAWAKGDRVAWFENSGRPQGRWAMHVLKDGFFAANQIVAADLTGDGRIDLAATADDGSSRVVGANELRWWKNAGRQAPGERGPPAP